MLVSFVFLVISTIDLTFASAGDCDLSLTSFDCQRILACQESSGVCQCSNGNHCAWNLEGSQTVNCPCFDVDKGFKPFNTSDYCISQFITNNCGYETACNSQALVGSCQCPDGKTSCLWSGDSSIGCPCSSSYLSLVSYRNAKFQPCHNLIQDYKCDPDGIMNCATTSGSCTCVDGSTCSWGSNYVKGCPCENAGFKGNGRDDKEHFVEKSSADL